MKHKVNDFLSDFIELLPAFRWSAMLFYMALLTCFVSFVVGELLMFSIAAIFFTGGAVCNLLEVYFYEE